MRALVLVLVAACTRTPMPLDETDNGVIEVSWPDPSPMRLDVLVVVDNSPAMAPYREKLAAELRSIDQLDGGAPLRMHVGVITGDLGGNHDTASAPMPGQCAGWGDGGALRRSPSVGDPFLSFYTTPGATEVNTPLSPGAAMVALGAIDARGCAKNQPLEAMRIALDHNPHNAGFISDAAHLAVVIIAAKEDSSPLVPPDYVDFLNKVKPRRDIITIVLGGDALRLAEFSEMFIQGGYFESIDALGMGEVFEFAYQSFLPLDTVIGSSCVGGSVLDVDPEQPGIQPDCSVHDTQQLIPQCGDTVSLPCWRVTVDPLCATVDHLRIDVLRGDLDPPDNNLVVAQCVAS